MITGTVPIEHILNMMGRRLTLSVSPPIAFAVFYRQVLQTIFLGFVYMTEEYTSLSKLIETKQIITLLITFFRIFPVKK